MRRVETTQSHSSLNWRRSAPSTSKSYSDRAWPGLDATPPRCTKCSSRPIKGQCTNQSPLLNGRSTEAVILGTLC